MTNEENLLILQDKYIDLLEEEVFYWNIAFSRNVTIEKLKHDINTLKYKINS